MDTEKRFCKGLNLLMLRTCANAGVFMENMATFVALIKLGALEKHSISKLYGLTNPAAPSFSQRAPNYDTIKTHFRSYDWVMKNVNLPLAVLKHPVMVKLRMERAIIGQLHSGTKKSSISKSDYLRQISDGCTPC